MPSAEHCSCQACERHAVGRRQLTSWSASSRPRRPRNWTASTCPGRPRGRGLYALVEHLIDTCAVALNSERPCSRIYIREHPPLREAGACSGAEIAEAERDCVEANAVATGVAVLPAQSAFLVKEQQVVLDFGGGDQVGAALVLPRESGVQARACPGSLARVESVVRRRAGRPRASAQTCAWPKPVPKCAFGRGGILSGFGAPGSDRVTQAKWSQEFPGRFTLGGRAK